VGDETDAGKLLSPPPPQATSNIVIAGTISKYLNIL
jgi:hypothetical protein